MEDILKLQNPHPRDVNIRKNLQYHKYYVNDKPISVSVTKFVSNQFAKFDSDEIIDRILKSNKMNDPSYEYYGMNKKMILDAWETSRILGTNMHADIERFYNDLTPLNFTLEYHYFLNFANDHRHWKPYRSEWMIYTDGLAGCIDMIYYSKVKGPSNPGGERKYIMVDWKRCKKIDVELTYGKFSLTFPNMPDTNYYHYCLQLNTYKYILEKDYGMIISEMYLCCIYPTQDNYKLFPVSSMKDEMDIMFQQLE